MLFQESVPKFNSPVTRESTEANLPLSGKHMGHGSAPSTQRASQVQKAKKKPTGLFPREGNNPRVFWETRLVPQAFLGLLSMGRPCYSDQGISYQQFGSGLPGLPSPEGLGSRSMKAATKRPLPRPSNHITRRFSTLNPSLPESQHFPPLLGL